MLPYYWQSKQNLHFTFMQPWVCEHDTVFPQQQRQMPTNSSEGALEGHCSCGHYDIRIHKLINLTNSDWGLGVVQYYHH